MAVHKHSYTSLNLTQQGGPGRRETGELRLLNLVPGFRATTLAMNYEALRQRIAELEADGHRIEQALQELQAGIMRLGDQRADDAGAHPIL